MFLTRGTCKLGGFENTLLGLKHRLYHLFENHESHMDVLMFGKVQIVPSIVDYSIIFLI